MNDAIISLDKVTKSYGGVIANHAVSLTVPRGRITGLIGPNGSGKTTLFNSIVGYHPIDSGSIRLDDREISRLKVPEIARRLGVTVDELKEHIEIVRNLDPKPGSRYNPSQSQYVIPDVYVVKVEDHYEVFLNEEGLPQLRISPVYRRLLDKNSENSDETRAYVKDKFRSALWLIKSVEQRQKTIHKVANSIINFQRDFLDHGIEHLRPLVLRDVANDIGMHESTVSRVVTNKYMHTPQGVFELKYFFHSGISSSYGESVSSVTIKQRIRKIIENEDPRKPLSDSKIVSILQKEGLMLARRTIAKYREELKIPTSNQRKVLF